MNNDNELTPYYELREQVGFPMAPTAGRISFLDHSGSDSPQAILTKEDHLRHMSIMEAITRETVYGELCIAYLHLQRLDVYAQLGEHAEPIASRPCSKRFQPYMAAAYEEWAVTTHRHMAQLAAVGATNIMAQVHDDFRRYKPEPKSFMDRLLGR